MAQASNGRSSLRLSDEELEYYADLYIGNGIREAGIEFESFLNNPEYYLQKHAAKRQGAAGQDGKSVGKGLRNYLRLWQRTRTPPD
ncbi:MAG: hypothetical protein ACM362_03105 [Candidatus Methylomirabilota bacterium]